MKRLLIAIALVVLVASACSSDGEVDGGAVATSDVGTPEGTDDGVQEPDTSQPAVAAGVPGDLAITEVVFDDHLTITNLGSDAVSTDGLWLCNRPNYVPMPTALIAPGESIEITDLVIPAGAGEVALYTSDNFGDSTALIDYVGWGTGGGRASVAVDAGLWPDGETVIPAGTSMTAPNGGSSPSDWS